jgi:hypothetical protein
MPEPVFMKLGMCIMAPEPMSMVYFIINPNTPCLYADLPIVARQVTAAANAHSTIEKLFDASFFCIVYGVSEKSRQFFPEPLAFLLTFARQ